MRPEGRLAHEATRPRSVLPTLGQVCALTLRDHLGMVRSGVTGRNAEQQRLHRLQRTAARAAAKAIPKGKSRKSQVVQKNLVLTNQTNRKRAMASDRSNTIGGFATIAIG